MRASVRDAFPVRTLGQVRRLFELELAEPEPPLALLSVVAGQLEHQWTSAQATAEAGPDSGSEAGLAAALPIDPPLTWSLVEALLAKFESIIRGYCDSLLLSQVLSAPTDRSATRQLIKHVADIVWNTLSKSHYKDRPHLQSLYSYLTGNKLDCFGVAFAVVASCQLLEVPNVHLALSEDHAWVVFGPEGTETAEVTWHGKGSEDKRGQPVEIHKAKTSWLYLAGQPVVCDRHMEVAALVSSINPAMSANLDSVECGVLQQELLWLLYDQGHLAKYPMALGNLGDLEEIAPSLGRPPCTKIFEEAIQVNRDVYTNHHVYPYTYHAGYYYRSKEYKNALKSWAKAAEVIKKYCYSKDDEEIYKEFLEIANELIPHTVKAASLNPKAYAEVLGDPECFAFILQFYDGICCWEEGSPTPVLHIGWAKPMVSTCSKFEAEVRARVAIPKEVEDDENPGKLVADAESLLLNNNYFKCASLGSTSSDEDGEGRRYSARDSQRGTDTGVSYNNNNECDTKKKQLTTSATPGATAPRPFQCDIPPPRPSNDRLIQILSEACKENILNVNYLLGETRSKPFLVRKKARRPRHRTPPGHELFKSVSKTTQKRISRLQPHHHNEFLALLPDQKQPTSKSESGEDSPSPSKRLDKVLLELHSAKMKGLKDLLCAEKLNTSAIQLQLTAQSQTDVKRGSDEKSATPTGRPKRNRRE